MAKVTKVIENNSASRRTRGATKSPELKKFVDRLSALTPLQVVEEVNKSGFKKENVNAKWVSSYRHALRSANKAKVKFNKQKSAKKKVVKEVLHLVQPSLPEVPPAPSPVQSAEEKALEEFQRYLLKIGTDRAREVIDVITQLLEAHQVNVSERDMALAKTVLAIGTTRALGVLNQVDGL